MKRKLVTMLLLLALLGGCSFTEPDNGLTIIAGGSDNHSDLHENGGADEISILNLSGLLADGQTPLGHYTSHESGGSDEIDITDLVGGGGGGGSHNGTADNVTLNDIFELEEIWGSHNNIIKIYAQKHVSGNAIEFYTPGTAYGSNTRRMSIYGGATSGTLLFENVDVTFGNKYIQFYERTAPGSGSTNNVRLYAVVGGDSLTDMSAVFQDGTVDIFAQEATSLTDARFTYPNETVGELVMLKPHAGLIKVVMRFPDGSEFVIKEIEYHDADMIASNKGSVSDKLPDGWLVETQAEREARNETERIEQGIEK